MKPPVYLLVYKHQKYLDFRTLLFLFSNPEQEYSSRSKLWRYLRKSKITSVTLNNKKYFLLNQILGDSKLIGMMDNLSELVSSIEEP